MAELESYMQKVVVENRETAIQARNTGPQFRPANQARNSGLCNSDLAECPAVSFKLGAGSELKWPELRA